ncbi:MAG: T9SS type A sorting domain-containing protein [Bacteroidales bacterium]
MEKLKLILAILVTLFVVQSVKSQITLLHTFNEYLSWTGAIYFEQFAMPDNSYNNSIVANNTLNIIIYNADFTVQSDQTYYFNPPAGYEVTSVTTSRKLFNDDDNPEFMVRYTKIEPSNDNTKTKAHLLDHLGNLIKDFGTYYSITPYPFLHIANNQRRLIVYKTDINNIYQSEIYSVPGEYSEVNESSYQFLLDQPFPNPSKSKVTLPYQIKSQEKPLMNIFNFQGMLIESLLLDSRSGSINLDVSKYTKGEYIYEVNGISQKFIVQ